MTYLNLIGTIEEINDNINKRYDVTQAALRTFTMAAIFPGRPKLTKWSDLSKENQKVYTLMAEDFLVTAVGDVALPLFAYYESWATASLLGKAIRNKLPRKSIVS